MIFLLLLVLAAVIDARPLLSADLVETHRRRIEASEETPLGVGDARIYCITTLQEFYEVG